MCRNRLFLLGAILCVAVAGCASPQPIGPGCQYQPNARERRIWQSSHEDVERIRASGYLYPDPKVQECVQKVLVRVLGNNLPVYAPLEPRVQIVDSPAVNAFSLAAGDIVVYTGTLGRMRNEAQLAMILGHEITHATHRHAYRGTENGYVASGAGAYVAVFAPAAGGLQNLISGLSAFAVQAAVSGYSRNLEEESDRVGLTLIAQAGYDPTEGATTFQRMLDATDKKDRGWNFLYATHPKMKERVDSCQNLVAQMPPEVRNKAHDKGQDRYLATMSELIYREVRKHLAQGRYNLALETVQFMRTNRPGDADAPGLAGDLYRARAKDGDFALAHQAYEKALEVRSQYAPAHRGLGLIYMKEGNKQSAVEHLARYLVLAPNAPDSAYIREYVEQLSREN